jgi:hypothetical protein
VGVKKVVWANLQSKASRGVATISKANIPPWTYRIVIDGDSLSKSSVHVQIIASQTLQANSNGEFKYNYDTSSIPEGKFNISIENSAKTVELKSKEQKKHVEDIPADANSKKLPLKVTSTDQKEGYLQFMKMEFWIRKIFNS